MDPKRKSYFYSLQKNSKTYTIRDLTSKESGLHNPDICFFCDFLILLHNNRRVIDHWSQNTNLGVITGHFKRLTQHEKSILLSNHHCYPTNSRGWNPSSIQALYEQVGVVPVVIGESNTGVCQENDFLASLYSVFLSIRDMMLAPLLLLYPSPLSW